LNALQRSKIAVARSGKAERPFAAGADSNFYRRSFWCLCCQPGTRTDSLSRSLFNFEAFFFCQGIRGRAPQPDLRGTYRHFLGTFQIGTLLYQGYTPIIPLLEAMRNTAMVAGRKELWGACAMLLTNSPSVQRVPIDALRLSATPVRRHSKKEIEKARKLLAAHGQVPPVLAVPNGEIIFWEAIWLALKADGATEVDAVIVTGKSPTELKALQLALNRIPLDASWDDQNVRNILEELVRVDFDLSSPVSTRRKSTTISTSTCPKPTLKRMAQISPRSGRRLFRSQE